MARLLGWILGTNLAESILGDLEEQRSTRAQRSIARAAVWYYAALVAIGTRALASRVWTRASSWWQLTRSGAWPADIKTALRGFRRTPVYAITATAVLSLSLTLAIVVFAVVDGVLLRPLPYPRSTEVVAVTPGWKGRPIRPGASSGSVSDFVAWQRAAPEVRFAAYGLGSGEQVDEGDRAVAAEVTAEFLAVLGQQPVLGGFRPEHFVARRAIRPALLTYGAWQRRFGRDPSIVGRVLPGDLGRAIEVVGVLPPTFLFPTWMGRFVPEVLTPLVTPSNPETHRGRGWLVLARMPQGMTADELGARLTDAAAEVALRFPKRPGQPGARPFDLVQVDPLDVALRTGSRTVFTIVFVLAVSLLVLACVNVTGLAAARTRDRARELVLRRALGAGGGDVIRLLATEAAVVVLAGTVVGLVVAALLLPAVAAVLPSDLALLKPLTMDLRVAVFATATAGLCIALTSFWPARVGRAGLLRPTLADGAATTRRHRGLARRLIVGSQIALALAMAIGGSLLAASWLRVWRQETGYQRESTVHLWMGARVATPWPQIQQLLETIRRVPGVQSAGGADIWMLQNAMRGSGFDRPPGALNQIDVDSFGVTAGFFETTRLELVLGRSPTPSELDRGAAFAIVSDSVARDYWPAQTPIGRTLTRDGRSFEVIGVARDARYLSLDREPTGAIYTPLAADPDPELHSLFVRLERGHAHALVDVISAITANHKAFRVRRAQALATTLAESIRSRTFQTLLFGVFGAAAVVIAGIGVLGLTAMLATRRTREVGVRMALGARPHEIARLMIRDHLAGAWAGFIAGGLLAAWLARLVATSLYKMSGFDPVAWLAACLIVVATIVIGALVPAIRASRIDPVRALRVE